MKTLPNIVPFVIFYINIHWSTSQHPIELDENNLNWINDTIEHSLIETNDSVTTEDMFSTCLAFSLMPDEYVIFENGTAYVEAYNKSYESSVYRLDGDILTVCAPIKEIDAHIDDDDDHTVKFSLTFTYITRFGLGISILCLVLHLLVFFIVSDMRNLPGYNLASMCFSLLFGYIFFMVAHSESVENISILCVCAGIGFQFFMLSTFLWMSIMAFHIFRSLLKATGKLRIASLQFNFKKYCINCLYSWGTALLFVIVTILLDNLHDIPDHFRPMIGDGVCWFRQKLPLTLLFAAPLMMVVISNFVLFGLSAYIIVSNRMRTDENEVYKSQLKRNFLIHGRLATIMGLSWIIGIIATLVDEIWLWYIYIFLNTLQGLFIFLAFTCTQKVKKYLKNYFQLKARKISVQSSSPTFQSYWNAGLSMDHDVDFTSESNIVKSGKV